MTPPSTASRSLAEAVHDQLQRAADAAGAPLFALAENAPTMLLRWLEHVSAWNRKIDLTAAKSSVELAELGVLDAAIIAHRVGRGPLVDVGTGFGAPGLAIALLRVDLDVTLVEPLAKRASFLRTMIGSLSLASRVRVHEGKGETLVGTGKRFAIATSRATLAPDAWVSLGESLAPEGEVVVLVAKSAVPVLAGREIAWEVDYATLAGAPRCAASLIKTRRLRERA